MMVFAHVQGEHLPAVRHQLGRLGLTAQFDRRLLKFRVPERDKVKLSHADKRLTVGYMPSVCNMRGELCRL